MTVSRWERDAQLVPVYIDLALQTLEREMIAGKETSVPAVGVNRKQRKQATAKEKAVTR